MSRYKHKKPIDGNWVSKSEGSRVAVLGAKGPGADWHMRDTGFPDSQSGPSCFCTWVNSRP